MKTQKYAVNQYLIESVLSKVREGEIAIPEIQLRRPRFFWTRIWGKTVSRERSLEC